MTTERVRGTVRLVADPALVGWDELEAVCLAIAGIAGAWVGLAIASALGAIK